MTARRRVRNTRSVVARAAAAEARAKRLAAGGPDAVDSAVPSLFIVRVEGQVPACRWEIRRFGAIVLATSDRDYSDLALARLAGEQALTRWLSGPDRPAPWQPGHEGG
jgi:hypothetical protein